MSQALNQQNQNYTMENQDASNSAAPKNEHLGYSDDHHDDFHFNQLSSERQKIHGQQGHQSSKHGWPRQDELLLYRLHDRIGNKWAIIAHQMKQRTDNCVKNHFYSKLRKALRKLNKAIHDCYKKQFKEIKMGAFYKIIQATEEGHRAHSNVEGSVSDHCKNLKNRLLHFADQFDQKSLQTVQGRQIAKKMIKQVVDFNRHYKRQSKKKRKCSGNDGVIYPLYFKNQPLVWEDNMSQQQSDDIFYSNSSKNSKNKKKQSARYQEHEMDHEIYHKDEQKNKMENQKKFQLQMRVEGIVQTEEVASPVLLRGNSKISKFSGRCLDRQQQPDELFFQDSFGICEKNVNYTLFEHLIKPDASQNL